MATHTKARARSVLEQRFGHEDFQPGQWEMAMEVTGVEAPGLPPAAQTQLRAMMNRPETSRDCMTADQAANPLRDLRAGMRQGMGGMGAQLNCEFANNDNGPALSRRAAEVLTIPNC